MQSRPAHSVLLVDDEPKLLKLLGMALSMDGYTVEATTDGTRAVELLDQLYASRRPPDTIITDLMLPGLSGLDLIRHVRGRDNDVRIVAISASVDLLAEAAVLGANVTLTKPFALARLLELVGQPDR